MKKILVITACLLLLGMGCNPSQQEMIAYPVMCSDNLPLETCVEKIPLNKRVYRIDIEKQVVFSWLSDIPSTQTQKYTKCAIVDINQWSCSYDDESGNFGSNNGVFFENTSTDFIYYVDKETYESLRQD